MRGCRWDRSRTRGGWRLGLRLLHTKSAGDSPPFDSGPWPVFTGRGHSLIISRATPGWHLRELRAPLKKRDDQADGGECGRVGGSAQGQEPDWCKRGVGVNRTGRERGEMGKNTPRSREEGPCCPGKSSAEAGGDQRTLAGPGEERGVRIALINQRVAGFKHPAPGPGVGRRAEEVPSRRARYGTSRALARAGALDERGGWAGSRRMLHLQQPSGPVCRAPIKPLPGQQAKKKKGTSQALNILALDSAPLFNPTRGRRRR